MLLCLLLSACGELSYKRGATSADLENARKNCQQEQASVATETCLQNSGWTVQKLDSMEVFEEIVLKKPTEAPATTNTPVVKAETYHCSFRPIRYVCGECMVEVWCQCG